MPDYSRITVPLLQFVGGNVPYNYTERAPGFNTNSDVYVLADSFTIATAAVPAWLTALRFGLTVGGKCGLNSADTRMRIDVDGVTLATEILFAGDNQWEAKADEVTAGPHLVEIYVRTTNVANQVTISDTWAIAGVGTDSAALVEVAYLNIHGESKTFAQVTCRADATTVNGSMTLMIDDNPIDSSTTALVPPAPNTATFDASLTTYVNSKVSLYAYSGDGDWCAYLSHLEAKGQWAGTP